MKKVYHWYPEDRKAGSNGYGMTACGFDGAKVGGLITDFFRSLKIEKRCKKCNKKFNKEYNQENSYGKTSK